MTKNVVSDQKADKAIYVVAKRLENSSRILRVYENILNESLGRTTLRRIGGHTVLPFISDPLTPFLFIWILK